LDKLRLPHNKRHRQREVPVRVLRHQRILLPQRSSRLRRDSKLPRRTCRRGSNRPRRQENRERQDNLQRQVNLECQAQRPVPRQLVQQVLLQPLLRVRLQLFQPLQSSLLDFLPATG
jgi:hypothetical protein